MSFVSWRGGFHTFKRCNRVRIEGKALEESPEAVDKVLLPVCRMGREAVASYHLLEHTRQACQFRLKVAVEEVQEEVRMVP